MKPVEAQEALGSARSAAKIFAKRQLLRCDFHGLDHDELAERSAIDELDASGDLREQGVVLATADVQARLHASAALAHDDRSARHELPAESLKAKSLRVRVAPVS